MSQLSAWDLGRAWHLFVQVTLPEEADFSLCLAKDFDRWADKPQGFLWSSPSLRRPRVSIGRLRRVVNTRRRPVSVPPDIFVHLLGFCESGADVRIHMIKQPGEHAVLIDRPIVIAQECKQLTGKYP